MSNEVILYWGRWKQGEYPSVDAWRVSPAPFSQLAHLSLMAHLKLGNRVLLYSHQDVSVPDGIDVLDAGEYIGANKVWDSLNFGHRIAYVSDLVRLRAGVSKPSAVIMDVDQVMLNPLPSDPCFISSIPIRMTGILALKRRRDWKLTSRDGSWDGAALCDFPVRIGGATVQASALADDVEQLLFGERKVPKDCGVVVRKLRTFQDAPCCTALPPLAFSPVPAWSRRNRCLSLESPTRFDGKTEVFGYVLPSVDDIMERSYAVSHWFESAMLDSDLSGETFWDGISDGCLLDFECRKVLGVNWRAIMPSSGAWKRRLGFGF